MSRWKIEKSNILDVVLKMKSAAEHVIGILSFILHILHQHILTFLLLFFRAIVFLHTSIPLNRESKVICEEVKLEFKVLVVIHVFGPPELK